jgi:hypothetical protein
MDVHPAHREKVAALVREFQGAAVDLVKKNPGALDQELRGWWQRFFWGGFTQSRDSHIPDDVWLQQFAPIRDPNAPVTQPAVVIGGAVAGGAPVVISDRAVIDTTSGVKVD